MNPDSPITPRSELESSLTALLLGELPHDQAAALHQKLAQDAELAKLYARLKQTVDLVRETVASPAAQTANQPAPLKLSDERRQKLLQQFKTVAPREFVRPRRRVREWLVPVGIAAGLVAIVAATLLPTLMRKSPVAVTSLPAINFLPATLQDHRLEMARVAPAPEVENITKSVSELNRNGRRESLTSVYEDRASGVPLAPPAVTSPEPARPAGTAIVLPKSGEVADGMTTRTVTSGVEVREGNTTVVAEGTKPWSAAGTLRGFYDDYENGAGGGGGGGGSIGSGAVRLLGRNGTQDAEKSRKLLEGLSVDEGTSDFAFDASVAAGGRTSSGSQPQAAPKNKDFAIRQGYVALPPATANGTLEAQVRTDGRDKPSLNYAYLGTDLEAGGQGGRGAPSGGPATGPLNAGDEFRAPGGTPLDSANKLAGGTVVEKRIDGFGVAEPLNVTKSAPTAPAAGASPLQPGQSRQMLVEKAESGGRGGTVEEREHEMNLAAALDDVVDMDAMKKPADTTVSGGTLGVTRKLGLASTAPATQPARPAAAPEPKGKLAQAGEDQTFEFSGVGAINNDALMRRYRRTPATPGATVASGPAQPAPSDSDADHSVRLLGENNRLPQSAKNNAQTGSAGISTGSGGGGFGGGGFGGGAGPGNASASAGSASRTYPDKKTLGNAFFSLDPGMPPREVHIADEDTAKLIAQTLPKTANSGDQVPMLGDMPLTGRLFRNGEAPATPTPGAREDKDSLISNNSWALAHGDLNKEGFNLELSPPAVGKSESDKPGFVTGLTRDDVSGLRYLLKKGNVHWEDGPANANPPPLGTPGTTKDQALDWTEETQTQIPAPGEKAKADALVRDGKLFYEMGKLDEADAKLKQALTADPHNEAAHYYLNLDAQAKSQQAAKTHEVTMRQDMRAVEQGWASPATRERLPVPNASARTELVRTGQGRQPITGANSYADTTAEWNLGTGNAILPPSAAPGQTVHSGHVAGTVALATDAKGASSVTKSPIVLPQTAPERGLTLNGGNGTIDLQGGSAISINDSGVDAGHPDLSPATRPAATTAPSATDQRETTPLYTRTFKVDANTFSQGLQNVGAFSFGASQNVAQSGQGGYAGGGGGLKFITQTNRMEDVSQDAIRYFSTLGVELGPTNNSGKALFFNDRLGTLVVRGTQQDMDVIDAAVQVLKVVPPQVNINSKFVENSQSDRDKALDEKLPAGALNLRQAKTDQVLDLYSSLVGRTVLRSAALPAPPITFSTQTPLTKREAIKGLEAALALNGITVVNMGDKFAKAIPEVQGGSTGARFGTNSADTGRYVTSVVELKHAKPSDLMPALQPLLKAPNSALPIDSSRLLVLRDGTENTKSILEKIAQLDVAPGKEDSAREAARTPSASAPIPQPEVATAENAFSTFSLNVSDVSFKLAAASLEKGLMPEPANIRSEEFINAFDYRDPEPPAGVPVAFAWERAQYPFAQNRDLLRFSVKTAAQGRLPGRPLNLVLLLDNSGSMERADRVRIIHEALRVLASQLQAQDKLSVVTFSRTAHLWVDGVPGSQAAQVAEQVSNLTPQGGTNLEDAMDLAYQTALRHYLANGINRVVLLTDGAANLGNVDPEALKQKVEANRKQGIALDGFGIGWEGYNDDLLEVLTRNGDGRYGFVNTPEEAATEFAGQLAGALHVAASDVKVQVEFNPARVTSYRQIGYAKHQLKKEQFRDNTVDAAEIAAAEAGNALYTVEVNPNGTGPLCTVRARFRIPGTADYREHAWDVPFNGAAVALDQASPAMRLAATSSALSEWLVASPFATEVTPDRLLGYLNGVPEVYGADARPKKLEWMIRQAKSIAGK